MKEIKAKDQQGEPQSWILPGNSISQDDFKSAIQKAEDGSFNSFQESLENFELWLRSREKK